MRISDWSSDVCSSDLWKVCQARPLRSRFARRTRLTKLYGRDSEVQRLVKCWEQVRKEKRSQEVVISGVAGIENTMWHNELQKILQQSGLLLVQCSLAFHTSKKSHVET